MSRSAIIPAVSLVPHITEPAIGDAAVALTAAAMERRGHAGHSVPMIVQPDWAEVGTEIVHSTFGTRTVAGVASTRDFRPSGLTLIAATVRRSISISQAPSCDVSDVFWTAGPLRTRPPDATSVAPGRSCGQHHSSTAMPIARRTTRGGRSTSPAVVLRTCPEVGSNGSSARSRRSGAEALVLRGRARRLAGASWGSNSRLRAAKIHRPVGETRIRWIRSSSATVTSALEARPCR